MSLISVRRDFFIETAFGAIPGFTRVAALGNNPDVDIAAAEDVWTGGGSYPTITSAASLEIVSASANDTAAGTGARTVRIEGLDASYNVQNVTVSLNGTTPVAISGMWIAINRAVVITGGSGLSNEGQITIRNSGAGTTRALMQAGYGITRSSFYTVPNNFTLQIVSMVFCINRPSTKKFATFATSVRSITNNSRVYGAEFTIADNPYLHEGQPGIVVAGGAEFGLRCTFVSDDNTDVTAGWLGVLKDNTVG